METREFIDKLQGIYVPLVTPLDEKGKIDQGSLANLVNRVIDGGVNGIVANGATAEFDKLDREQRIFNLAWIVHYTDERVPVVANVTDNDRKGDFDNVLERTKLNVDDAAEHGASAVMICPYYYDKIANGNLVQFVEDVAYYAGEKNLPVVLYNNPGLHHEQKIRAEAQDKFAEHDKGAVQDRYSMPIPMVEALKEHENIVGIKDSSGDLKYFKELLELQDNRFRVFQGSERDIYKSHKGEEKPSGIVPSMANVVPEFVRDVYDNLSSGNQGKLDDACKLIYGEEYKYIIDGIKYALSEKGFNEPTPILQTNRMIKHTPSPVPDKNMRKFWKKTRITV